MSDTPVWEVAANELYRVTWSYERMRDCIRRACETHAAALAQERDALRDELMLRGNDLLAAESELDGLRADIARLTAERDRLRAELLHAANTMDAAIIDEDWSADDFRIRVEAARAALSAPDAPKEAP